ncbi:MAG TPA: co-chaperone GroES [Planctomycetota bacterium]|nr:co-chaperone GroES [Planctomycetota bacterium]
MAAATKESKTAKNIRPLDDRILIKALEAEEKTAGGIVLPDTAKEKPQRGKVVAVGPGKLLENGERAPLTVKVGNTVIYGKYAGTEIKLEGEEHTIMRENEILAVLEG